MVLLFLLLLLYSYHESDFVFFIVIKFRMVVPYTSGVVNGETSFES